MVVLFLCSSSLQIAVVVMILTVRFADAQGIVAGEAGAACISNSDCGEGLFCGNSNNPTTSPSPSSCVGAGICRPRPDFCTMEYNPVCGCSRVEGEDGVSRWQSFSNACLAAAAGSRVNLARNASNNCELACDANSQNIRCFADPCQVTRCLGHEGIAQCERICGGCTAIFYDGTTGEEIECSRQCRTNADCVSSSMYCASSTCGGDGICTPKPEVCSAIYNPVCGCDGRSYASPCRAAMEGVNADKTQSSDCTHRRSLGSILPFHGFTVGGDNNNNNNKNQQQQQQQSSASSSSFNPFFLPSSSMDATEKLPPHAGARRSGGGSVDGAHVACLVTLVSTILLLLSIILL